MCGGYNPLKDIYKTTVFRLCEWRNAERNTFPNTGTIPQNIITKPPSAELKPGQVDSDSLPPYDVLDDILEALIEQADVVGSYQSVVSKYGAELVNKIQKMLDRSEYKRRQSCPGVKLTKQLHGRDRRYPIVNGFQIGV